MNTVPTPIVDKNGKQNTVHKSVDKSARARPQRISSIVPVLDRQEKDLMLLRIMASDVSDLWGTTPRAISFSVSDSGAWEVDFVTVERNGSLVSDVQLGQDQRRLADVIHSFGSVDLDLNLENGFIVDSGDGSYIVNFSEVASHWDIAREMKEKVRAVFPLATEVEFDSQGDVVVIRQRNGSSVWEVPVGNGWFDEVNTLHSEFLSINHEKSFDDQLIYRSATQGNFLLMLENM